MPCELRALHDGSLTVIEDCGCDHLIVTGMVTGDVHVPTHGHLTLRGLIGADLIVDEGGNAAIHGMVCGNVITSGIVDVYGLVLGHVLPGRAGSYIKHRGAHVHNRPQPLGRSADTEIGLQQFRTAKRS